MRARVKSTSGYTVIELTLVVTMLSILATMAMASWKGHVARARRTEALMEASYLYIAEHDHFASENRWATTFDELGFGIEGGHRISGREWAAPLYHYELSGGDGSAAPYVFIATGEIDADLWPDQIVAFGRRDATIVYDDLFDTFNPVALPTAPAPSPAPTPADSGSNDGGAGGAAGGSNGNAGENGNDGENGNGGTGGHGGGAHGDGAHGDGEHGGGAHGDGEHGGGSGSGGHGHGHDHREGTSRERA